MHDRHDLIDEQWALLEPLLPDRTPRRGGQWNEHRLVVDGVLWRTRTGSPWRDLPASYGNWKTAYNRQRRWSADGTWARVLSGLQRGCDAIGRSPPFRTILLRLHCAAESRRPVRQPPALASLTIPMRGFRRQFEPPGTKA